MNLDEFLAECDDVIDDWEGSDDSAEWAADGSHEYDPGGDSWWSWSDWGHDLSGADEFWRVYGRALMESMTSRYSFAFDEPQVFTPLWHDPITAETRALLEPRPVDPMHPPRYLFAPRESA